MTKGKDWVDRTFQVGMILKGLDGLLELLGGLLLLLIPPTTIAAVVTWLTQHELSEDPHDFVASHLLHTAEGLTHSAVVFGSVYLLAHGIVKLVLVAAVLKAKLWAYPWMIAFLMIFIAYQIYRMTFAPSIGLVALTIFDAFIAWLTFNEYQRHRQRSAESSPNRPDGR